MSLNKRITQWQGLRVWVIGASTGIGAATAENLLAKGAMVAVSARRASLLEDVCRNHSHAMALPLDITDAASVQQACDTLLAQWHGIDLVLVCAGTHVEMRADSFNLEQARRLLDINVGGVLNCLAAVLPVLLRQKHGGIGIVSSVAGYSGLPKALVYGPSKAALINLCESLYLDLHDQGIGVYLVNPGFVDTPLTQKNDFPMPALMTATDAAQALVGGIEKGDFHIHFPKRFTNGLRFARLLPYRWYFPLIRKVTGL